MDEQNLQELKKKLLEVGAPEAELDDIIQDVHTIIMQRVFREYLETVNDPELRKLLDTTSETDEAAQQKLMTYFNDHKNQYPTLTEEKYVAVAAKTWEEYFDYVSS
jgi:fructose-1,6-bisphosphatase/inositol monophosphatase family enzyme